jgi:hypothetical protein
VKTRRIAPGYYTFRASGFEFYIFDRGDGSWTWTAKPPDANEHTRDIGGGDTYFTKRDATEAASHFATHSRKDPAWGWVSSE